MASWFNAIIISFSIILVGLYFLLIHKQKKLPKQQIKTQPLGPIFVILAVAFIFRIAIAPIVKGYGVDIGCFTSWSEKAFNDGLMGFYNNGFSDYPPGYIYILFFIGAFKSLFNISTSSGGYNVLLKLPAIIADICMGYVIYSLAIKRFSLSKSLALTALYVFNPIIWFDASVWGQVDSVFAIFAVLSFIALNQKKLVKSTIYYALALLIKPQALILFPIFLWFIIDLIFIKKEVGSIKKTLTCIGVGIVTFVILCLPFSGFNLKVIYDLYLKTLSSYPYATLNASNLYGALGHNWAGVESEFIKWSFSTWSTIFIVITTILSGVLYFRFKNSKGIFICGAYLIISTFILSAKMHERYMFPAIALLMLAYIINKDKIILAFYGIFSVTLYLNVAQVLEHALRPKFAHINPKDVLFITTSTINVVALLAFIAIFIAIGLKNFRRVIKNG